MRSLARIFLLATFVAMAGGCDELREGLGLGPETIVEYNTSDIYSGAERCLGPIFVHINRNQRTGDAGVLNMADGGPAEVAPIFEGSCREHIPEGTEVCMTFEVNRNGAPIQRASLWGRYEGGAIRPHRDHPEEIELPSDPGIRVLATFFFRSDDREGCEPRQVNGADRENEDEELNPHTQCTPDWCLLALPGGATVDEYGGAIYSYVDADGVCRTQYGAFDVREDCHDGVENNCDGRMDLADPQCENLPQPDATPPDAGPPPDMGPVPCPVEQLGQPCETDLVGVCAGGVTRCVERVVICVQLQQPSVEATACGDGQDNDCDGLVDAQDADDCACGPPDHLNQPCYGGLEGTAGVGVCRNGVQLCDGGVWGEMCYGERQPEVEICDNGLDDDCDGGADLADGDCGECDSPNVGQQCATGLPGVCDAGIFICQNDVEVVCQPQTEASAEVCDWLDNDCDGEADEETAEQAACGLNDRGLRTRECQGGRFGAWSACADMDVCVDGRDENRACGPNRRGMESRRCEAGQWTEWSECADMDVCVDGRDENRACGPNGMGTEVRICADGQWSQWGPCRDGGVCVNGTRESEPCGLNGTQERLCENGRWGPYGACMGEDACEAGEMDSRACGRNGRGREARSCVAGEWGLFGACNDPDECSDGAEDTLPCGINNRGEQLRLCVLGHWQDAGDCNDPDECRDGSSSEQACGNNNSGRQSRMCVSGSWGQFGACMGADVCVNDAQETRACGRNDRGRETRTCQGGMWSAFGACADPDVCVDDAREQQMCQLDGGPAQQERVCVNGGWSPFGACRCVEGRQDTRACGPNGNGVETRTCRADRTWGPFGQCVGGGDCQNGATRPCPGGVDTGRCNAGQQTCAAGIWGVCVGGVQPQAERCDQLDWDCDGTPADGFNVGGACSAGEGACERGGQLACLADGSGTRCNAVPGQPAAMDDCGDNVDDDCNGVVDDGAGCECAAGTVPVRLNNLATPPPAPGAVQKLCSWPWEVTCAEYWEDCEALNLGCRIPPGPNPQTPSTVQAYLACLDDPECDDAAELGNRPVNYITFAEAQTWSEAHGLRLPTHREWQLLASGGDGRLFPWGNAPVDWNTICQLAVVFHGGAGGLGAACGAGAPPLARCTRPADPRREGLCDMAAGMWEYITDAPRPQGGTCGGITGGGHTVVICPGGLTSECGAPRSDNRDTLALSFGACFSGPNEISPSVGFRPVADPRVMP